MAPHQRKWLENEKEFAKTHYGPMTSTEIAKALNRSGSSVRRFLSNAGIRMSDEHLSAVLRRPNGADHRGSRNPNWKGDKRKTNYQQKLLDRAKYPEKHKARNAVMMAIRYGHMKRLPCEICGNVKSEGHHEDYDKPLDVIWLCRTHHKERHAAMKQEANNQSTV